MHIYHFNICGKITGSQSTDVCQSRMKWKQQSSFDLFTHCAYDNWLTYEPKGTKAFTDIISCMTPHIILYYYELLYTIMKCYIALSVAVTFTYDFELTFIQIDCR